MGVGQVSLGRIGKLCDSCDRVLGLFREEPVNQK